MSREIPLTQGKVTIVDDDDFEWLNQHKWYYQPCLRTGYARRGSDGLMHRAILNPDPGRQIDHINGDGLDNRRCNLRICTGSQNQQNSRKRRGCSSMYKGVCRNIGRGKPWMANICVNGKLRWLGCFEDQWNAARAYNVEAARFFGEFAKLNVRQNGEA